MAQFIATERVVGTGVRWLSANYKITTLFKASFALQGRWLRSFARRRWDQKQLCFMYRHKIAYSINTKNTTILSPCFLTCRYSNHRKTILFNIISLCANQTTIISDIIYFVPLPFRSGISDFLKPVTARKSTPAYVYYTKRNYNAG